MSFDVMWSSYLSILKENGMKKKSIISFLSSTFLLGRTGDSDLKPIPKLEPSIVKGYKPIPGKMTFGNDGGRFRMAATTRYQYWILLPG